MDILNLAETFKNRKISAGTVILLQGASDKALIILHSGLAEMLSTDKDLKGLDEEQIIKVSTRVGLIKGESVCGIMGLRSHEPYQRSIRTISDCIVSSMPVDIDKLLPTFQSNIKMNLQVLRALVQRIESAVYLFNNYSVLWRKLASIQDSLALAAFPDSCPGKKTNDDRYSAPFIEYCNHLYTLIQDKKTTHPKKWDHNVLLGKPQETLDLYSEQKNMKADTLFDNQQFVFIKRLLRKSDQLLAALLKNDEPFNFYIFQFLGKALQEMIVCNEKTVGTILQLVNTLFGGKGWITEVLSEKSKNEHSKKLFLYYLGKFSWRCKTDAKKLLDMDLEKEFPVYSRLGGFEPQIPDSALKGSTAKDKTAPELNETSPGAVAKYKNLLPRILEFSDIPSEKKKSIISLLDKFKKEKKKFENETKLNKLKADFSALYWDLYENCFLKIIDTDLKSFIPGVMLHFGLLDERMVSGKVLQAVDAAYSKNLHVDKPVKVMTLPYFLEKIYKAECKPSITDMGESFRDIMLKQKRLTKKEAAHAYLFQDTAEDRVRYEIRNISLETMKLLYGSRKKAFPVLCNEAILGDIDRLIMDPERAAAEIDAVRKRDFSVFYREIVLHHKFGSDIIKKEVVPNFVLYPGAGSRMMMWQELDGAKRDTEGRIFMPYIFNEKLEEGIISILAHFRWELQKVMAGAKWMDAVEGGLVGAYYDYINFYKKNPNLTPTMKETVHEFVKKTRSDRERFTNEYLNWILYEYEGRLKLTPVAREIFYRYCPFTKEVRAEMAKKPIFTNLEMKFQNRANAAILKSESRKKKFEKSGEKIPEDYLDYLEFLNR